MPKEKPEHPFLQALNVGAPVECTSLYQFANSNESTEEREAEKVNCSLCNKVLATRATLTYHMKTKHPESGDTSNPVACDGMRRLQ